MSIDRGMIGVTDPFALGEWESVYIKAFAFVSTPTTAQKLPLITGSTIGSDNGTSSSALSFLDGDMGLQKDYYVSAFSLSSALSMTWDRDAIYAQAKAVGGEFYGKGLQIVAGLTAEPLGRTGCVPQWCGDAVLGEGLC
ncbi:hypothetical protein BJX70DRAFT_399111 [Aspergillus crustosus]